MIPFPVLADLAKTCAAAGPALANHLWQSTVFAAVAGLLTLALRSNQARARYWIWMAASVKFVVPFALLMSVGGMMVRPRATAAVVAQPSVYLAMEEVSQPFVQPMGPVVAAPAPDARERIAELAPGMVAAVWAIGFAAVVGVWVVRWRRVARAMREAAPMGEGREAEVLRRLEQAAGLRGEIELRMSAAAMEPGVFGLGIGRAREVLAWPAGISGRLDEAQMEAVLAHEVAHVRRRDNLTAAMHMLVEAVFWFHPLVWWLGARLLAERERACDEEVLLLCGRPAVYAEGILKVCEFCVESPLACVSGVTGADLKQRIVEIMTARVVRRIGLGRKLLLLGAGMVVVAVPVLAGRSRAMRAISSLMIAPPPSIMPAFLTGGDVQANTPADEAAKAAPQDAATTDAAATDAAYALGPEFEVATIRPTDPKTHGGGSYVSSSGRFEGQNTTLRGLVYFAYGSFPHPSGDDASGGPDWAGSEHFDVEAKVDDAQMANWSKMSDSQRIELVKPMLRRLLVERFQLKLHTETHIKEVFALVQAKGGAKLKEVSPPPPINDDAALQQSVRDSMAQKSPKPIAGSFMMGRDGWVGNSIPIGTLVSEIAGNAHLGGPLVDQTGLKGYYDFAMKVSHDEDAPLLTDQVETQLGLKVESRKLPLKTYVIDAAEKPSVDGAEVQEPPTTTLTHVSVAQQPPVPAAPAFDVATIKPNDPSSHGGATAWMQTSQDELKMVGSLKTFLKLAYGFEDVQIAGGPGWLDSDLFEIDAKASSPFAGPTEVKLMLRDLLNKRFALSTHTETKPLPVYSLVVAKDGPKLQRADESGPRGSSSGPTLVRGTLDTGQLAHMLTPILGRAVIDNTGLHGSYKIDLTWAADDQTSGPSLFTAVQEQLGLKLEPTKGPVETLVIDHAEKPSEN